MCVLCNLLTTLVAAQATNSTERKYPKEVNSRVRPTGGCCVHYSILKVKIKKSFLQ